MNFDDGTPKKLPKRTHKRQIKDVCLYTVGYFPDGNTRVCGEVFKSWRALSHHINTVHKGKKVTERKEIGIQGVLGNTGIVGGD